jgi:hypothetical protein
MSRANSNTSLSDEENECPIANTFQGEFILNSDSFYSGKYDQQCKMVVNVIEKIYDHEEGNPHWYYINYAYFYIGKKHGKLRQVKESYRHPSNPFYGTKNAEMEFEGTIIHKNDMTEQMIKYLVMSLEELAVLAGGRRCPEQYKKQIIHSLAMFW